MKASTCSSSPRPPPPQIQVLPKEVVDRIAAGEVVQRPASVVKELIENCLDANSTCIDVACSGGGLRVLAVSDDGDGICPGDLSLAATRFATSKLVRFDDLKSIRTYGFRGEALASASMVSRLSIISRRRHPPTSSTYSSACAYKQNYRDGSPTSSKPHPCAGNPGTIIRVEDLFYNVPSRKRAFSGAKKETEEYNKVLSVVQRYAVHRAGFGVAFVCRKSGGNSDLNTQSIPSLKLIAQQAKQQLSGPCGGVKVSPQQRETACKDVIAHVFGSSVARELLTIRCGEGDVDAVAVTAMRSLNEQVLDPQEETKDSPLKTPSKFSFAYSAFGLITNGSYSTPKSSSAFILFLNDRLVSCPSLQRAIEGVYADTLPKNAKPFVYFSLDIPGPHVDVNVHPTKREVALLHEDLLCDVLASKTREVLLSATTSRTFYTQMLLPKVGDWEKRRMEEDVANGDKSSASTDNAFEQNSSSINTSLESSRQGSQESELDHRPALTSPQQSRKRNPSTPNSLTKNPYDPKRLVRTTSAAPAGALEPFLISTQSQPDPDNNDNKPTQSTSSSITSFQHTDSCEFAQLSNDKSSIDMSLPGAFATICRCQVQRGSPLPPKPPTTVRPKKVIPTECTLSSIRSLRHDVTARSHRDLALKLRESTFVGCVSRQRSLIQCGIELILMNHFELSKELFYQLALAKFGGVTMAKLGSGVDVTLVLKHALSSDREDDDGGSGEETRDLDCTDEQAEQATQCLKDKCDMLHEYFSISFELQNDKLILMGLPVLLDGHQPSPHALPLFLLRLATEVDWTEEQTCFEGICTELGAFYAEIPFDDEVSGEDGVNRNVELIDSTAEKVVKHALFPALSYLLVPPKEFATDGSVVKLAALSSLYKVFERC